MSDPKRLRDDDRDDDLEDDDLEDSEFDPATGLRKPSREQSDDENNTGRFLDADVGF